MTSNQEVHTRELGTCKLTPNVGMAVTTTIEDKVSSYSFKLLQFQLVSSA